MVARKKKSERKPMPSAVVGVPKWKSLKLNEAILNCGVEGLVGIEELTNYTLLRGKRKSIYNESLEEESKESIGVGLDEKKKKKKKSKITDPSSLPKSKKRKSSQVEQDHTLLSVPKKLKLSVGAKKNKSKVISSTNVEDVLSNPFLLSEKLEEIVVAKPTSVSAVVAKKSKKKKRMEKKKRKKKRETDDKMILTQLDDGNSIENQLDVSKPTSESSATVVSSISMSQKRKALKEKKNAKISTKINTEKKATVSTSIKTKKKRKKKTKTVAKPQSKKEPVHKDEDSESDADVVRDVVTIDDTTSSTAVTGMEGWAGLNLPQSILQALADKGFYTPTEIQALSLPAAVLGRRDIMGAAETGSGKTLAFGIPIIYGILQQKRKEAHLKSLGKENGSEVEDLECQETNGINGDSENDNNESENWESDDEGYVGNEKLGLNEDGIGCVRVIDDVDMGEMGETAASGKPPRNPAHNQRLYALVLTPTRELAIQVRDHLKDAAKYTSIRVAVVVGGLAAQKQERLLRTSPEIVVATPGRLWELIQEGNAHLQQVNDISFLAIDETDRMIEKGHFQELRDLMVRINQDETKKKRRQNFVFSATLTAVHEPPRRKKRGKDQMRVTPGQKLQDVINMLGITHPKVVDVTQESGTSGTLEEAQIGCSFEEKDFYLYYFLIKHPGRTLVFCNSISCVRRLSQLLIILRCRPLPIHAGMVQRQRLRNLDKFRDSPTGLLLATDVAARGLDIPNVQHVIHYQVPRTSEGYIHRSGRTARASKEGLTVVLVEPDECQVYTRLCRTLGRDQELPAFPISQDLLGAAKQRVMLARDIDQLELKSRRADSEMGWFQKAMTEMEVILDKDDLPMRISEEDTADNRRAANGKRKQLDYLLSRPLFASRM